jgi:hypothetical protein
VDAPEGNRGPADVTSVEADLDLHRGVAAGVEDLPGDDVDDLGHGRDLYAPRGSAGKDGDDGAGRSAS